MLLVEEFGRAGAEIVFADRPVGTGAEQDLLLQVQGVIAECERGPDPRARPARASARRALRIGQRGSGELPFGHRTTSKDEGGGVARVRGHGRRRPARVRLMFAQGPGWTA